MKRLLLFLVLIICLFAAVACGDEGTEGIPIGSSGGTTGSSGAGDVIEDNHVFDDLRYQYNMSEYVSLPSYSTHSAEIELDRVTREIDMLLMENSQLSDRKICVMSDVVEIVYTGYLLDENGQIKVENGKELTFDQSDEYLVYLGSSLALAELERGIVGMTVGEIKEIYVTLPPDYSDEELQGQAVMYEVILNAVYDVPVYNNSFIKKVFSDLNTTAEYEDYLKKSFVLEELYEIIKSGAEIIKMPELEHQKLEKELLDSEDGIKEKYNMTLDEYLEKEYSMTRDEYINKKIRSDMVLYALAEREGVEVTLELLKKERARLVNYYRAYYKAHGASDTDARTKAIALVDDMGDYYVYEAVMSELLNRQMNDNVTYTEKEATYSSVTSILAEREGMTAGNAIGSLCPSDNLEVFDENGSLGTTVDPTKNIGRLTVINFWGTWCPYCLIELPHFDRVAKECGDDVTIYAVHSTNGYGTAPDYVLENCEESKIVFLKDYEANGKKNSYYSALGGDGSYPFTVILDEKGIIVSTHVGAMTYEQLMGALRNAGLSENG